MGDYGEQPTHDVSGTSDVSGISVIDGGEEQACFMCLFSKLRPRAERDAPCAVRRLNGQLLWAREREVNGTRIPSLMLDLGLSYALISLDPDYYRDIVRDMYARGDAVKGMSVVIYHLPTPVNATTYKDRPLSHYIATSHTLVVLEPDILLNITDLSQADYCTRKYLLNRLVSSPSSAASVRGNIVHYSFTNLLKGDDQQRATAQEQRQQPALDVLRTYAEQALDVNAVEMAFASVPTDEMRLDVIPHLESLATWYEQNRNTLWGSMSAVRAETLLLVPEIGLRGRLDLFWEQLGSSVDGQGSQSLLELKTGGASGSLPKGDHRRQVHGYQALLAVRQNSKMKKAAAKLLYSGTPGQASDFALRLELTQLQRINALRNTLVLNHITGTPSAPPPPSRCSKCSMLASCARISSLLDWQPPRTDTNKTQNDTRTSLLQLMDSGEASGDVADNAAPSVPLVPLFIPDSEADRAFFRRYYQLLQLEGIAEQQELATLWKLSVEERVANGKAIRDVVAQMEPIQQNDGWVQVFDCDNQSELREGDEVLVSDGDPITGEVVTGTLLNVATKSITVWMRERIEHPRLIDSYGSTTVHMRTLQNLLRWLDADIHLRELVSGQATPLFEATNNLPHGKLNERQYEAVERAMQMRDYLLIQGPPGTGKTSVIAEIVKNFVTNGQRVLLAAFTNQAVDNMLKRLDKEGFHQYIRIGHERSTDITVQERMLKRQLEQAMHHEQEVVNLKREQQGEQSPSSLLRTLLTKTPVIASTTATWSSATYSPQLFATHETEDTGAATPFLFDVAIIDEASQLTLPAILGALRFAKRFILVGDEKQLPPLVMSKEAAEQGLNESLFTQLSQQHPEACAFLTVQYRMNKWISNFSSTVFYEKQLMPDISVANRQLSIRTTGAHVRHMFSTESSAIKQSLRPEYPLVFLDVCATEQIYESEHVATIDERRSTGVKVSVAEARAIREVVDALRRRGIAPEDIGVIAPYRAQVATIRRTLLHGEEASSETVMVDTVDRFQGGEREVIIFSFATMSEPAKESTQREFLTNAHRLNVALTRAKSKLILVGCVPALENLPILSRLITYCRSMKTIIPYTPDATMSQTSVSNAS